MKVRNIIIGLLIIAFAVIGILEVAGVLSPIESVIGEISAAKVVALTVLVVLTVVLLSRGHILPTVFVLAFIFMVIEMNLVYIIGDSDGDIINNWALLAFAAIICVGLSFILPDKKRFARTEDGVYYTNKGVRVGNTTHALGSYTEYIDCATFTGQRIENNLGRTDVRFENVSEYTGDAVLTLDNNIGNITVYVPAVWRVCVSVVNNLGGTHNGACAVETGPVLYIRGENNLGGIDIVQV